ncbi:MAG: ribosomal RNA small subunit methyltransferase A [Gemmatimonadetes bacterium]|nr:16S rRNA (adenine(1518)-N(6)/adenine(1519)-N(6))-dimethyltransferase RsmA [Gemmatimonadota bacterium]MDE2677026.1 16S rRNA (adenine(1518)-N(6)/adenine(1519)-N(6))-dimethyltransferase RsmA [Gemmatimonadota bacterium]MXX35458.1 ribosomal RNA small subunit methyltransferase A [Gemmatimonadota bacterium]MYD12549.1 ribosomal RNA small subunit methyltransferase A [Gemmatimonadota bacterium]MYI66564.1 ribosomal RNA small subunit methyltransferase A [Gemmatimonadota bacterium]
MKPRRTGRGRPKRSLGQNFLVDPNLRRKIAAAVGAGEGEPVLEIGAGRGALTDHLVQARVALTAVELDDELAPELAARYRHDPRTRVVHGDVLSLDLPNLTADWTATRVVGNIPYNITTPIIFKLLTSPFPADIVLTMQAEVAARILAGPGSRTYGALSVGVAVHAEATRVCRVPRGAFRPVPKVDSVALRITPRVPQEVDAAAARRVRTLTRAAFSWRRKQLGKILHRHPDLRCAPADVERALAERSLLPSIRPEQLSADDYVALSRILRPAVRPPGRRLR